MKTLTILFCALLVSTTALAQNQNQADENVLVPIETTLETNTSLNETPMYVEYLQNNLMTKAEAFTGQIQGTEVIRFEMDHNGNLTDFEVINSISPQVDNAVYEILNTSGGMYRFANNNGKSIPLSREVAVKIKMVDNANFDKLANKHLEKGREELFANQNPQKALRHFNRGMKYRPYNDCLLVARGACKYELGDKQGALADWERIEIAGFSDDAKKMVAKCCDLQGYATLTAFIENE